MNSAVIGKRSCLVELMGNGIARAEVAGLKCPCIRCDRMRRRVIIRPRDVSTFTNSQC
jgi:hypothetical protein